MKTPKQIITNLISSFEYRSCWNKGVHKYALELLAEIDDHKKPTRKSLLNGASDWFEYSYGGCSLTENKDIAKRLCTPSELRRNNYGERDPNRTEYWVDCQARALGQACNEILRIANHLAVYDSDPIQAKAY